MQKIVEELFSGVDEIILDENGFICYPMLLDSDIEKEMGSCKLVKSLENRKFIAGLNINHLVDYYIMHDREGFEELRKKELKKISKAFEKYDLKNVYEDDDVMSAAVFEVMPYFAGRDALERLRKKIKIGEKYYKQAEKLYNLDEKEEKLRELATATADSIILPKGKIKLTQLERFVMSEARSRIILQEKTRLSREISEIKKSKFKKELDDIATLLCLKNRKRFEFCNFGFKKECDAIAETELTVYVKIGSYVLRAEDSRLYLFPQCKVGVSADNLRRVSEPFVIDKYKHPFLGYNDTDQDICIRGAIKKGKTLGENIINHLEAGINALLTGYSNKSRPYYFLSDGDEDRISFKKRRINENHPLLKNGKVKITNEAFMKYKKSTP